MPQKIAMISAGSVVFCKTLMSPTEPKLRRMEAFGTLVEQKTDATF